MLRRLFIILMILLAAGLTLAQGGVGTLAHPVQPLNLRSAPSTNSDVITALGPNHTVVLEARNEDGGWVLVHTESNSHRGWMALSFLRLETAIRVMELPLSTEVIAAPNAPPPAPDAAPGAEPGAAVPVERTDYPALNLNDAIRRSARGIYARGQQLGNNPNAFIKIGESNTAGTVYLCPFHYGNYDLGGFTNLQAIVGRFQPSGSFCQFEVTAQNGMSSSNLLDPLWAVVDPRCGATENPLQCAYRLYKPSYAFIYMGIADQGFVTSRQFTANMTQVIRFLKNNGVIPILTTYPMADVFSDGKPEEFNAAVRQLAETQQVPLIDLRAALYNYENRGTGQDGYHLSVRDTEFTSFAGDQDRFGRTLRELLSLQVLEQLAF